MFNRNPTYSTIADRFIPRLVHHARFLVIVPLSITLLVACGNHEDKPTPTVTSIPLTATTTAATATIVATTNGSAPTVPASPVAGGVTAGELADRITAAWSSVTTYRTTTTITQISSAGTPVSAGSPAAGNQGTVVTIGEVILPDRKHWISQTDGVTQYEFIAVEGRIYGHGPSQSGNDDQSNSKSTWFEIDPTTVDPHSVFATLYEQLLAPVTAPYTSLSAEVRSRDAVPVEPRTVDGQTCAAYQTVDTTQTGERIEIVIALGANDLPCSIETRVGGQQTISTYTYNLPLTITAPVTASPAAGSS